MAVCLEQNIEVVKVKNLSTDKQSFQQNFPDVTRGFSERNIRLLCSRHRIRKLDNFELDNIIQQSINEVLCMYNNFRQYNMHRVLLAVLLLK